MKSRKRVVDPKWRERALRELVPGVRIRITSTPSGLFDVGAEIVIEAVHPADDWVYYHYPEDFVWESPSGERFPFGEMFGESQTGLEPFCDPEWLQWEVVGAGAKPH